MHRNDIHNVSIHGDIRNSDYYYYCILSVTQKSSPLAPLPRSPLGQYLLRTSPLNGRLTQIVPTRCINVRMGGEWKQCYCMANTDWSVSRLHPGGFYTTVQV